jgi:hypothetical protein
MMEYLATNLPWLAAGVLVWLGALAAYRLYLSPLAKFPGPKLAALTGWYETYCDCMKDGSFWIQIEQFHKQYGRHPISLFQRNLTASFRTNRPHQPVGITRQ